MPEKMEQEEYEIIPVLPLRKLEKRIEELETERGKFSGEDFLREVVDIIKMNQSMIEEMAKSNDALKLEMAKLPAKIDALLSSINELVSYIKSASLEEATVVQQTGGAGDQLVTKLNDIVEGNKKIVELSQTMVSALEEIDKKIKRTQPLPPPLLRRSIPPLPPLQPRQ